MQELPELQKNDVTRVRELLLGLALLVFVGCGGATTFAGGDGGPGGPTSTGAGGGIGGSCSISGGTYTQHFTAEAGPADCPDIPDQKVTIGGSATFTGSSMSGPADGGDGCTGALNSSTCTSTATCTTTTGDVTITTSSSFSWSSAKGNVTMTMTDSAGTVVLSCSYEVAATKS